MVTKLKSEIEQFLRLCLKTPSNSNDDVLHIPDSLRATSSKIIFKLGDEKNKESYSVSLKAICELIIIKCIIKSRFPKTKQIQQLSKFVQTVISEHLVEHLQSHQISELKKPFEIKFNFNEPFKHSDSLIRDDMIKKFQKPVNDSNDINKIHLESIDNFSLCCLQGNEIQCFLFGQQPKQINLIDRNGAVYDDQSSFMSLKTISETLCNQAFQAHSTFFRLLHDVFTLNGIAQSLSANDDVEGFSRNALNSMYKKEEQKKKDDIYVSEMEDGKTSLEMGDLVVERDELSGKIRMKPRRPITDKNGNFLIEETVTIRKISQQPNVELLKESAYLGFSTRESINIGLVCSEAILYLVSRILMSEKLLDLENMYSSTIKSNEEGENQKEFSSDNRSSVVKLCDTKRMNSLNWPTQLCDNFLLFCLRLLSITDFFVRIQTLKLLDCIVEHCSSSTLDRFSSILVPKVQRLFPLVLTSKSNDALSTYLVTYRNLLIRCYDASSPKLYLAMKHLLECSTLSVSGYQNRVKIILRCCQPLLSHLGIFLSRHATDWIKLSLEGLDSCTLEVCNESLATIILIFQLLPNVMMQQYQLDIMKRLLIVHSTLIYPMREKEARRKKVSCTHSFKEHTDSPLNKDIDSVQGCIHQMSSDTEWIKLNQLIKDVFQKMKTKPLNATILKECGREIVQEHNNINMTKQSYNFEQWIDFIHDIVEP